MSNTNGTPTRITAAQVWRVLEPVIFDESAPPLNVRLHSAGISVDVELGHNDRRAADKVIEYLGLPPAYLHLGFTWSEGEPDELKMYGHYYKSPGSPLLPGWRVQVYCHIYTQADASEHWDGLILPECDHQAGCPRHGDVRDCDPMPAERMAVHAGPYDQLAKFAEGASA